jgi:hypothetical protein
MCSDRCAEEAKEANEEIEERIANVKAALSAKTAVQEQAKATRAQQHAEMAELKAAVEKAKSAGFLELEKEHNEFISAEQARKTADKEAYDRNVETAEHSPGDLDSKGGSSEDAQPPTAGDPAAAGSPAQVDPRPRCDWDGKVLGVVGEQVEADYQDLGEWVAAEIEQVNEGGSFNLIYTADDEKEENVGAESRADNARGPGGPMGPLCTPLRNPGSLSRPRITH